MFTRRNFIRSSGAAILGAAVVSKVQAASLPEAVIQDKATTVPPPLPPAPPVPA